MIRAGLVLLMLALPARAEIAVPSGQAIAPLDILWEDQMDGRVLVARFLAGDIARGAGRLDFAATEPDMDHLCAQVALSVDAATGGTAARILIVLLDRPVPRGVPDPAATQFINAYRPEGGRCIWEGF